MDRVAGFNVWAQEQWRPAGLYVAVHPEFRVGVLVDCEEMAADEPVGVRRLGPRLPGEPALSDPGWVFVGRVGPLEGGAGRAACVEQAKSLATTLPKRMREVPKPPTTPPAPAGPAADSQPS